MTTSTVSGTEPRLFRWAATELGLADHRGRYGPLPERRAEELLREIERSGLTGRGGGRFATGRKLRSVAGARRAVVIGNGCEGEPASGKDAFVLHRMPHLVLDGLTIAARAVGAREVYLAVAKSVTLQHLEEVLAERRAAGIDEIDVKLRLVPDRFLSGEESALVNAVEGFPSVPRATPPRVYERGAFGRPTAVLNVETLAHLAMIVRYGADWFREVGSADDPGTMLVTISGAVHRPGVAEVPRGASLAEIVATAGGPNRPAQAVLVGGYHGTWVAPASVGAASVDYVPGAGVVVVLPTEVCGLAETARAAGYLAAQSAGQCGPCLNGLPALAAVLAQLARPVRPGSGSTGDATDRVWELARLVEGRGACHHPDGAVRFARSAMVTFAAELAEHAAGRCSARSAGRILPTPGFGG